jgi:lipopolysaccharide transport system ATP-binding protein
MNAVIHADSLSKRYRRGALQQTTLLRDHLGRALRSPLSLFRRPKDETFWALKDVSLDVREGEVLGLIGRNGAGKTTLLKILSRITRPTEGWAEIHGRVGSLLEVGTGFHPELTGRENTFLSGAILGMSRSEIIRKFDEIVAFAELEKFIDTPVKHYSSGMYVRLAFAVAAHLEPEILLVDEVAASATASSGLTTAIVATPAPPTKSPRPTNPPWPAAKRTAIRKFAAREARAASLVGKSSNPIPRMPTCLTPSDP